MLDTELTDEQKVKVEELLSSLITNKERSHEPDLRRASVLNFTLLVILFFSIICDFDSKKN